MRLAIKNIGKFNVDLSHEQKCILLEEAKCMWKNLSKVLCQLNMLLLVNKVFGCSPCGLNVAYSTIERIKNHFLM